ncbi:hypothetical protein REC12_26630 [Desulfosporosinus sp. PR]|uniref:hypothetical protein n=1 Tax=Candidatus Desulfosporosinus nitrosoreducens TaxID=3401928 RepID=UPI0027FCA21C|nr:hypothetical protein [Desulfosporosinus sp. PR]MDQ7097179.1 hypothetical protein [Desulfosporosinus sp. PR]
MCQMPFCGGSGYGHLFGHGAGLGAGFGGYGGMNYPGYGHLQGYGVGLHPGYDSFGAGGYNYVQAVPVPYPVYRTVQVPVRQPAQPQPAQPVQEPFRGGRG